MVPATQIKLLRLLVSSMRYRRGRVFIVVVVVVVALVALPLFPLTF
jgi:hypothetical protein